ncbi:MAG: hypothetical protein GY803_28230 [Chloroflexi bacterium]|nr:hypothetical protein [Chloroflexota bacterium]
MTIASYDRALEITQRLNLPEQLRLLETLTRMVRYQVDKSQTYSIMDLEGLGADIWQDIDAQTYINQERVSWDS